MLKRPFFLFLCTFSTIFCSLTAQNSNLRWGSTEIQSTTILLDSLSILPNSLIINGLEKEDYAVDEVRATLTLRDSTLFGKRISYSYRVFPLNFAKKNARKSLDLMQPKTPTYQPYIVDIQQVSDQNVLSDARLQSSGSIARGMSIGNNQDFVLNSSLNLQLSGYLSEDLEILANITDKNVPIQPEGNTRIIQDFDKIFVRLNYKNQFFLNAGDIDVVQPNDAFFMKLNKRLLGMEFTTDFKRLNSAELTSERKESAESAESAGENRRQRLQNKVGGGIAKGKFVRQTLTPINGVQGPYKLQGADNEQNIVILSGSERLYVDDKLLTRGQEYDYTIDYNIGEITFTARQLITTDLHIVVEFEYSDFSYSRYALYTFNQFEHEKNKKWQLNVNFYHEQDLKNRSIQPELNHDQMAFLSELGDDHAHAFFPNIDTVAYNANEILYKKGDTIVDGVRYAPIYLQTVNAQDSCYRLKFSFVGENGGNYVLLKSAANGRVFGWVAPQNGVPQGNYEPVLKLVSPKMTQMATIAATYNFAKESGINTEIAFSNYDENTFSAKNDANNASFAAKIDFFHKKKIRGKKTENRKQNSAEMLSDTNESALSAKSAGEDTDFWYFQTKLHYQYIHQNFHAIEDFRDVEFARDYNLVSDISDSRRGEQMLEWSADFSNEATGNVQYQLNYFSKYLIYNALRNELSADINKKGFHFTTKTAYLFSSDSLQRTNFLKTKNRFSKAFRKIEVGVADNLEYDVFESAGTRRLRENSYAFNEAIFFFKNNDSLPYRYEFSLKNRIDHVVKENVLAPHSLVHEAAASFEIAQLKNHKMRGNATFRNTQIKDSNNRYVAENQFVGSLEYRGNFCRRVFAFTAYYEAGSGLEQKKTFSYLKVAAGQGNFVWRDYNGNGIEELNEFEVALFQDEADYVKIWLPSTEFVSTYNSQLTATLQIRPAAVWNGKSGWRKFLARFTNNTSLRTSQKNTMKNSAAAFNPFLFHLNDSLLVANSLTFKNLLTFNPQLSYFGFDFIVQHNQTKNMLYYGFESTALALQEIVLRSTPLPLLTLKTDYVHQQKRSSSDYLAGRSFDIRAHSIDNSVILKHKNRFECALSYIFKEKRNKLDEAHCQIHEAAVEASYRVAAKIALTAKVQYVNISFNAAGDNSLAYEMLEGLQAGNNAIWGVTYQQNLTDYLEISLLYEGRAAAEKKVINTGCLQLRAHF